MSSRYEIHRDLVLRWKREVLTALPDIFGTGKDREQKDQQKLIEDVQQIGQLKVENDWLKKKLVLSTLLCKIIIGQFFEERQIFIHFSHWV